MAAAPPIFLTPRQRSLYIHRFDSYRFTEPDAIEGKPQPKTWAVIQTNVPCYIEYTESDFGLNAGALLTEEDILWTLDILHTAASVDLKVGDVVKITVGGRTGIWRLRGNEKVKARRANKQSFRIGILEAPPEGVPK